MKFKNLFLFTLPLICLLASCSSDDEPEVPTYVAEMTSFGFYVEDNEGVIVEDYVVSPVTQTSISVLLPEDVDKSRLVARFTVSENDVVKVGEVVQQSGVTPNDFTGPVDYIVSEGTANVRYTVTVGNAPAFVWTALPAVGEEEVTSIKMKVSPAGIPYIVYKMEREETDDEGLGVMVLKDGQWTLLGQASEGRVDTYYDIAFKSDDNPVVSYSDYTASRITKVKSWNGTAWSSVGSDGVASTNRLGYVALNYVNDNKLMVFGRYEVNDGAFPRRALNVNIFENGAWTYNQAIPGRASDLVASLLVAKKLGEVIYVGAHNSVTPNTISIYKYENNAWTAIIDQWTDENATGINLRAFDIDVDNDGNVYAALADNASEGVFKQRIIKWNAETKEISNVGSYLTGASGGLFNFDLALSPLGVPYLFYRNESSFPTVVSLDKDTQDWTTPNVLETSEADDLSIDFAPDGKAFISYTKDRTVYSYKYDAPEQ